MTEKNQTEQQFFNKKVRDLIAPFLQYITSPERQEAYKQIDYAPSEYQLEKRLKYIEKAENLARAKQGIEEEIDFSDAIKFAKAEENKKQEETKKACETDNFKKASKKFGIREQAKEFWELQPYYYDSAGIWWLWNSKMFKWERVDEIDILNAIESNIGIDTISSKKRWEIINCLKQSGRLQRPKEPKKAWIQFKDKIIDIDTKEIISATPLYLTTNPIPYSIGESDQTPTIDKLFTEWVGEKWVDTLYEVVAYCCLSHQFLQTIIALTGAGSNGKSTFLQFILKFLGQENCCSTELGTLTTRNFESSALYKKLVCFMGEVGHKDMKNTNLIKSLSGEERIRYEFKGKTPFMDHSPTTCIIATNSLPITNDKTHGFYRRWIIIDFPNQFKVKKDILAKIPEEEYNALAKKIVAVIERLKKNNTFTNGGDIEEKISRYEERSNPLQSFIEEYCNEDDPNEKVKLREFVNRFNDYLKKKKLRLMTAIQIGKQLREEGYETKTATFYDENKSGSSHKAIIGIQFKNYQNYRKGEPNNPIGANKKRGNCSNCSNLKDNYYNYQNYQKLHSSLRGIAVSKSGNCSNLDKLKITEEIIEDERQPNK